MNDNLNDRRDKTPEPLPNTNYFLCMEGCVWSVLSLGGTGAAHLLPRAFQGWAA